MAAAKYSGSTDNGLGEILRQNLNWGLFDRYEYFRFDLIKNSKKGFNL